MKVTAKNPAPGKTWEDVQTVVLAKNCNKCVNTAFFLYNTLIRTPFPSSSSGSQNDPAQG